MQSRQPRLRVVAGAAPLEMGARSTPAVMWAAVVLAAVAGCSQSGGQDRGDGPVPSAAQAQQVARGRALYEANCAACHGPNAEGERPEDPSAVDAQGLPLAPALNGSMHAWHHTDEGLVATILQGSPRNPRMVAWGEQGLTEADARSIVVYVKTMWGDTQRRCQGPRHMDMRCLAGGG